MKRTDKQRIDYLEKQDGIGLISDDAGRWVVAGDGIQTMPDPKKPIDILTNFYVEADQWKSSVRAAIDSAMDSP